jgi:uncharacterized oligopeptide transporter (OPT) family protein
MATATRPGLRGSGEIAELTLRVIILGSLINVVFNASNV